MPIYYKRDTNPTNSNWNQSNNWSTVSSTSSVNTGTFPSSPTSDPVIFDSSSVGITVNVVSTCASLTTTGFAGTITLNSDFVISSNHIIGSSTVFAGSAFYCANGAGSITSNGVSFPNFKLNRTAQNFTLTLNDVLNVVNIIMDFNGAITNGFSCNVSGLMGFAVSASFQYIGTTVYNIIGASASLGFNGVTNAAYLCTININSPGNVTFLSTININTCTFNYIQGNVITTGNTFNVFNNNWITSKNIISGNEIIFNNFAAPIGGQLGTTTLTTDIIVVGNFSVADWNGYNFNGNKIFIGGSISNPASLGQTNAGTSVMEMYGSTNATVGGGRLARSLIINKSSGATVTFTGNVNLGAAGLFLSMNTTTLFGTTTQTIIGGSFTINNSSGSSFYNLTNTTANAFLAINNATSINNNLTISVNTQFGGSAGWTCANLLCSTAGVVITYQSGVTYLVNNSLVVLGTAASRITFQSSNRATFSGIANGTSLTYQSGTIPLVGMTLSHTSGAIPVGLNNLLPVRPTIASGSSPNFVLSNSVSPTTGTISLTAGNKANLILASGASQTVGYITSQDIDSSAGQTIYAFDSINDTNLFRTLNWERLIAPVNNAIGFINFS